MADTKISALTENSSPATSDILVEVDATGANKKVTIANVVVLGVSNTAYAASWDNVTTIAPSKNAVYDKIEAITVPYASAAEINTGTEAAKAIAPDQLRLAGQLVQVAHAETRAVATGTTVIPKDDTIPQITEGDEYLTCSITPKNANNQLLVMAHIWASETSSGWVAAALFRDAVANALSAGAFAATSTTQFGPVSLKYKMTSGGTSAITFRLRAGPVGAATMTVNGQSAARQFGSVLLTSITIFEYAP